MRPVRSEPAGWLHRIWESEDPAARAARRCLAPAAVAFGAVVAVRNGLYDTGVLRVHVPAIPVVSVGNLSVGGTGKTPVAAWLASQLRARGAHPAVVLRGYGGDEPLVYGRLTPEIPVFAGGDRVAGVAAARAEGADVVVLDDAFQHRRIARAADIVLVSADRWTRRRRHLPTGPWREPITALRRATLVMVTRKACTADAAASVGAQLARVAPRVPIVFAHLAPATLDRADGTGVSDELRAGEPVLAISGIGDTAAWLAQLDAAGVVARPRSFADHRAYTAGDARRLAADLRDGERAVCTLKDAVKLGPLWPRAAPPLWYVSQRLVIERGGAALDTVLESLLAARAHPA